MCSIIGYVPRERTGWEANEPIRNPEGIKSAFTRLFEESRIRGHHAYGIAWDGGSHAPSTFDMHRSFNPEDIVSMFDPRYRTIAHCRFSTSGDWKNLTNSQPIVGRGMALAFNGVIHMGTKEEFEHAFDVQCAADNDGEVFLQKLHQGMRSTDFLRSITGSFAGVWLRNGHLFAARNAQRPLWVWDDGSWLGTWFASTKDIFERAGFEDPVEMVPLTEVEL